MSKGALPPCEEEHAFCGPVSPSHLAQPFGARLKRSQVCRYSIVSPPVQDGFSRSGDSCARPSNGAAAGDWTAVGQADRDVATPVPLGTTAPR